MASDDAAAGRRRWFKILGTTTNPSGIPGSTEREDAMPADEQSAVATAGDAPEQVADEVEDDIRVEHTDDADAAEGDNIEVISTEGVASMRARSDQAPEPIVLPR